MISLPTGWSQRGELPRADIEASDEGTRDQFDEDIVQVCDPSGTFMIDVGWYPAESPAGNFVCKVIEHDNWDEPLEEFTTRKLSRVIEWVNSSIQALRERCGEPAEIVTSGRFPVVIVVPLRPPVSANTQAGIADVRTASPEPVQLAAASAG